jgi:isopenicillin N synthase-like dioxygenase
VSSTAGGVHARVGPSVDTVDISRFISGTDIDGVVDRVRRANERIGFLVIEGHGVPDEVITSVTLAARAFFALPLEEKLRYVPEKPWWFRGYQPTGVSALGVLEGEAPTPDLCELFRIGRFDDWDAARAAGFRLGREASYAPNVWPSEPIGLRPAMERYYRELERLAATLMEILAMALDLPRNFFADKIDRHISDLFLNYYPAQLEPPLPGQLRRGPHSDFGSLTVLYQDDAPGGLQVIDGTTGEWTSVPHVPGTFVINLGDLMARWTNGRWVSTRHRVVNPSEEDAGRDRLSMPFFHQPNYDAVIETLPTCRRDDGAPELEPVLSGEWALRQNRKQLEVS